VVTTLEYQLHEVGQVLGGMILYPIEQARDVLRLYRQVTETAPDALGSSAALLHAPDGAPVCGIVVLYNGPIDEGERAVQPYREIGTPIVDAIGPMPYVAIQSIVDEGFPAGAHNYWRGHFLTDLTGDVIDTMVDHFSRATSPLSLMLLEHLGGAVARVGRDETAFNHRDFDYNLIIIGRWLEPSQADEHIAWTRGISEAVQPFGRGVYVNYLGVGEKSDRVRAAYGEEKFARLVELKNRYDPQNRFCFNQNVPPA
jgi:hypothetical protein